MIFNEIYKPTQGRYVRVGTLIGVAILMGFGMYWLGNDVMRAVSAAPWVTALVVLLFAAAWAAVAIYFVNSPRWAEFMIMTESEMRKVHWPSRQMVLNSTKVVILLTLILAILLFLVDLGFLQLFKAIGLLAK